MCEKYVVLKNVMWVSFFLIVVDGFLEVYEFCWVWFVFELNMFEDWIIICFEVFSFDKIFLFFLVCFGVGIGVIERCEDGNFLDVVFVWCICYYLKYYIVICIEMMDVCCFFIGG